MKISRYPPSKNRSLQAWSSADEYLLSEIPKIDSYTGSVAIFNDRFGYLTCHLRRLNPLVVAERKSQLHSIQENLVYNGMEPVQGWVSPLDTLPKKIDLAMIIVPKSMNLYRHYLNQIHKNLSDSGRVLCGFMTRHFTPQMLTISKEFFDVAEQGLAWKKSRLLNLREKKERPHGEKFHTIPFTFPNGTRQEFHQYHGVFSSGNIDYATQFLIENLAVKESEQTVLDLACGNGVIARAVQVQKPGATLHLTDDSILAVESAKLNMKPGKIHIHWEDTLNPFQPDSFDLVVSNPPFHFGHENNIDISIRLFGEVHRVLKPGGRFLCVANRHLNYHTHIKKIFSRCSVCAQNEKYVVYESIKPN